MPSPDPLARTAARTSEDGDFFLEPAAEAVLLDLQIVTGLQIQPETLRGPEVHAMGSVTSCGII